MNFDLAYSLMLPLLMAFQKATHSYGFSIILLTLVVRICVWPLVAQSTKSMKNMSSMQPEMKKLQAQYKDDPALLQQKTMEFYKENKVNPFGGCLPTLIQLPVLFALFATFSGPPFGDKAIDVKVHVVDQAHASEVKHTEVSGSNSAFVSEAGQKAKVIVFPGDCTVVKGESLDFGTRAVEGQLPADFMVDWRYFPKSVRDPDKVPHEKAAGYRITFNELGDWQVQAKVPGIAKNERFLFINGLGKVAKGVDLLKPENFDSLFLIALFGLSMYFSQKFTVVAPKVPDEEMDEQQKVQRDTMKMMPLTMTGMFFFIPLPTGVFLYMVVSNIVQTLQTWLIMKTPSPQMADVSADGTVTMSQSGNTFSVDPPAKEGGSKLKMPEDAGQKINVPRKKKKKRT